ncbi:uncharacterized protein F4822DRAFT_102721 [Hypoxylon trugodes]|uniref:uncharacterized protein n=1 Tax=Hypoxylon trugodes TaxID=326681 RepID=UPI002196B692|nr:uncharacterized protein F4822DRAFT_102721 [Hypoxylon trugodes]KAI1382690.1 hypothetical protein F4822DRAFT_102721 [Hypoxylon trugodes]
MGRPPAFIFIVRHGKRLDAADKQWHISSPTPYDPPLTYGGWLQSKAVGARIASILQESENENENEAVITNQGSNTIPTKQKKRRYKIVIHSSPFLRCVQTSVSIAAGLASNPSIPSVDGSPSSRNIPISSPPSSIGPFRAHSTVHTNSILPHDLSIPSVAEKSILRLDPFLGEWLSPDYFEHITPPPRSSLMLMTAKAELLRRENYNDYPHFHSRHASNASSQLWSASPSRGSPLASSMTPDSSIHSGLDNISSLRGDLPRYRSDSLGNLDPRTGHRVSSPTPPWNPRYVAPVPSYALSTSEPIPQGYVAHARDACVEVDYQWDSSREDFGWGDGGVLPEEWAAMHQRFRKGLRRLVEWYTVTEKPAEMVTKTSSPMSTKSPQKETNSNESPVDDDDQTEVENVVVLVSHGAGCNALIGAITQQPVLIDVGMSSITMAQRKLDFDEGFKTNVHGSFASSLEEPLITKQTAMSEIFELKLFANTEHLHSTMSPPSISRSSSAAGRNSASRYNNGFPSVLKDMNLSASLYGAPTPGARNSSTNASLGSMRRGSPVLASSFRPPQPAGAGTGGSQLLPTRPNRSGSMGLWSPPNQDEIVPEKQPETPPTSSLDKEYVVEKKNYEALPETKEHDSFTNNVESQELARVSVQKSGSRSSHGEERDTFDEGAIPRLWSGTSNAGLWGNPRPPGEAERIRDFSATKRRWTVTER